MGFSLWHILLVLVVILIVFGAGKLPNVMQDLGRGIRNFKAGLEGKEDETHTETRKLSKDEEK